HRFDRPKLDSPAGRYQMGARYYDPTVGRFPSRDPIGPGYEYGANNPLSFRDPSGLSPIYSLGEENGRWVRTGPGYGKTLFDVMSEWWNALPPEISFTMDILMIAVTVASAPVSIPILVAAAVIGVAVGVAVYAVTKNPAAAFSAGVLAFTIAAPGLGKVAAWSESIRAARGAVEV